MCAQTLSTNKLVGAKVVGGKDGQQRIGKIHCFIFHPSERRCIGFLIKRPDLLLMFHRPDSFVTLDGFELEDGVAYLFDEKGSRGETACKKLGVKWDDCVIWEGLSVCLQDGAVMGQVGGVEFDAQTGQVVTLSVDDGLTSGALLGRRDIPASLILGFKKGIGTNLASRASYDETSELTAEDFGAILVKDEAAAIQAEGGLAEKAGQATAVAGHKIKETTSKAAGAVAESTKETVQAAKDMAENAKPAVSDVAKATGKAVNKGAYVTGRQISRAKGMFSAFKSEYDKARKGQ